MNKALTRDSIARRLLLYILICSSLITAVLTVMQLYREYRIDVDLIGERLEQIQLSNLEGISQNLWTVNYRVLQVQLDGMARLPDIRYLAIRDASGATLVSTGEPVLQKQVTRRYPLSYVLDGRKIDLGELTVSASLEGVYDRLVDKALVILLSQGVKTFLVSGFILFIVYWMVARHLGALAGYARRLSLDRLQAPPLDATLNGRNDELSDLVHALDQMRENLARSYAEEQQSRRRFEQIFQGSNDAIFVLDPVKGVVVDCNPRAQRMLGYSREELDGMPTARMHPAGETREFDRFLAEVMRTQQGTTAALSCLTSQNEIIPAEISASRVEIHGRATVLAMVRDRTEQRKAEQKLAYLAYHDSLTHLPNRQLFCDRLGVSLAHANRRGGRGAVLFMDLDDFKVINDSLGHGIGDQFLQILAQRLVSNLREDDTVARLGGDEFVILLEREDVGRIELIENVNDVCGKLRDQIHLPFLVAGHQLHVTASIGIALYPEDGHTVDEVLRRADSAMYQAKVEGKDRARVFNQELEEGAARRLSLQTDVHRALQQGEFILHFQQQVDLKTLRITGAEALLRWVDPQKGLIGPEVFIPLLEESGQIVEVGRWVLRNACENWRALIDGNPALAGARLAVNVSPREFREPDYCEFIEQLTQETGLDPANLELELTEQVVIQGMRDVVGKLERIGALGVRIAIDDFGTGYSSLSYLHRMPVHTVKIDRSFVARIGSDKPDAVLVDNIIVMAHKLGLCVVAEGVETPEQEAFLREHQCDLAQGYHYGWPVSLPAFPTTGRMVEMDAG